MISSKENCSIFYSLRDRELGNGHSAYRTSLKIISKLIRSEHISFKKAWHKKSSKPIVYENGLLHLDNYKKCFCIYGKNANPSALYDFQPSQARKKVADVITYGFPTYKSFKACECGFNPCVCFSGFMLSITEDNWINKHNLMSGKLLKNLYVKRTNCSFGFKYIDWNGYADEFTLTSILNPHEKNLPIKKKSDVLVNIAVFSVCPLEFKVLLEIKRNVFGNTCNSANVNENLLLLGLQSHRVHIYNFEEFLKGGFITPYHIGEKYENMGRIGEYPVGIPLNFQYYDAPPLLFNVQSHGHTLS
ncbi:DDB1- and CUL4-associated factor 17-like isoform X2 [Uloborus diversus]|uniref:DDB1- and CUL4-associated factor 17-like isoform X2 n=1 Tax=Uloborus diversus TaxID=327109 RepID=UPI002409528F|nr:DDB1- and CUL4-associated factor 17-like isoform X2 [Uloborus diversus]